MTDSFEKMSEDASAFQKLFMENLLKTTQAAFKFAPDSTPPELLRQMRTGVFQSLSEAWEAYLRSPQFLDTMRQWMDNAISFRKISNEFLGRVRNDMQAPSRSDIDTVMLAVRHMETRLLGRLDELGQQIEELRRTPHPAGRQAPPKVNGKGAAGSRKQPRPQRKGGPG